MLKYTFVTLAVTRRVRAYPIMERTRVRVRFTIYKVEELHGHPSWSRARGVGGTCPCLEIGERSILSMKATPSANFRYEYLSSGNLKRIFQ